MGELNRGYLQWPDVRSGNSSEILTISQSASIRLKNHVGAH